MADQRRLVSSRMHFPVCPVLTLILTLLTLLHMPGLQSWGDAGLRIHVPESTAPLLRAAADRGESGSSARIIRVAETAHARLEAASGGSQEDPSSVQTTDWFSMAGIFALGLLVGVLLTHIVSRMLSKKRSPSKSEETLPSRDSEASEEPSSKPRAIAKKPFDPTRIHGVDEQLIQSNKLTAFGQLATGVAHEINNPLAIINEEAGWLEDLLKQQDSKDFKRLEDFRESLGIIVQQMRRCANITHKLLSFAQSMDSEVRDLDLNEILDEIVTMMEKDAFYNNIVIEKTYDTSLPKLRSDPGHLRQLFVNLIKNAFDAIKRDGRVFIQTRKVGENHVSITLTDTGCGIPKEYLDKVFDPFFTTKSPGEGTGLGLSICYGIVTMLGGNISVESVANEGTTFTVNLPLNSPSPEAAA